MQLAAFVLLVAATFLASSGAATPRSAAAGPSSDFNGDGIADLAIGAPLEDVLRGDYTTLDAGGVTVLYGSRDGLSHLGNQFWSQDTAGGGAASDNYARFGSSLAHADFDGDGFADLAVGAPYDTVDGVTFTGAVNVLYGSLGGLSAARAQYWHQAVSGVEGDPDLYDLWAYSLAAGDFDADGYADLAVGAPGEEKAGSDWVGQVNVLYGSPSGLTSSGNQLWSQDSPGVEDEAEPDDGFGSFLAAGDFNRDGNADLAVGVGHEGIQQVEHAGAVNVLYGSAAGLSSAGNQFWSQDSPGVPGSAEHGDDFGWFSLAAADWDGDGAADLAVAATADTVGGQPGAGAVNLFYGSAAGLSARGARLWSQDSPRVRETAERDDHFGFDLAAGDFDGDGRFDLAIGVPGENGSDGAVNVIFGTSSGLRARGNELWSQDSSGILDAAEADAFGSGIAVGDWGLGPEADLAVGAPLESLGGIFWAGAANVIYGSPGGLTPVGNQFWHQDSAGILEQAEREDQFGAETR